jgi:predicted esterase
MTASLHPHGGQPVGHAGAPLGQGRAVVICVHGRNAEPRNILELAGPHAIPDVTYLAPAAANRTWYPYSFLAERAQNEPGLSSGLRTLDELVAEVVAGGVPRERVVLLGFSQGACLAAEFTVRQATRIGGLVVFSGGLIGPPGTTWASTARFNGMPVFLGCSDMDSHIPKARVEDSAAVFTAMGAAVTMKLYPGMGHLVNDDEIAHALAIIRQAMG